MPAVCWEVLARTGFESRWGPISVAVPMVYLAMLSLRLACRRLKLTNKQSLPFTRHAATDMSAIFWGNDCKQLKMSGKPGVAGLSRG